MEIENARHWLERSFEELRAHYPTDNVRLAAFERFAELGFPTTRDEDWKYTSLNMLARGEFRLSRAGSLAASEIEPFIFSQAGPHSSGPLSSVPHRLVFVNGRYCADLSDTSELPAGVQLSNLGGLVRPSVADSGDSGSEVGSSSAIAELNTAILLDRAVLHLARDVRVERPIQLLFVSAAGCERSIVPVSISIELEENSAATVIESHIGLSSEEYLTSVVSETRLGRGAWLEHLKLGLEGEKAYHLALCNYRLGDASRLAVNVFTFGGRLVRNELRPMLLGQGIEAFLNGLTVIGNEQHVDNHLDIDHCCPNCFSRQLFKGIYGGRSGGVFSATIHVRPNAQKTNAVQSSKSLLLSADASVNVRPQLKIFADDVKCTHGATVGQLDDEALFYLRSRGIGEPAARNILIHAFARDVLEHISLDAIKQWVDELLTSALWSILERENDPPKNP